MTDSRSMCWCSCWKYSSVLTLASYSTQTQYYTFYRGFYACINIIFVIHHSSPPSPFQTVEQFSISCRKYVWLAHGWQDGELLGELYIGLSCEEVLLKIHRLSVYQSDNLVYYLSDVRMGYRLLSFLGWCFKNVVLNSTKIQYIWVIQFLVLPILSTSNF